MSSSKRFISKDLQQWAYNWSGFNQLGLLRDDVISETPVVKEAIRRLPAHIRDERIFRIVRAIQLDFQKRVLPKEQWTKLEEDVMYLQPYLQEVLREKKEQEEWDAQH